MPRTSIMMAVGEEAGIVDHELAPAVSDGAIFLWNLTDCAGQVFLTAECAHDVRRSRQQLS